MRTERQRRERQMLDITKAREAKTHEFERACKVAAVTARLRPPPPPEPAPFDYRTAANKAFSKHLADHIDKHVFAALTRRHDDFVDTLKYAAALRLP